MKTQIEQLVTAALQQLADNGVLAQELLTTPKIERARDTKHGDFATNLAMVLAKPARRNPRELAQALLEAMPTSDLVERCEIAGPGFINFYLSPTAYTRLVPQILTQGHEYGRSRVGAGKRVQVEYVSANPTGPLHVG
ncbi:MAG: arginine--tRNA ligase, partial [Candidatus Thiodiazotropha sp.]